MTGSRVQAVIGAYTRRHNLILRAFTPGAAHQASLTPGMRSALRSKVRV